MTRLHSRGLCPDRVVKRVALDNGRTGAIKGTPFGLTHDIQR